MPIKHFENEIKAYALNSSVTTVGKKIELCARQNKTVQMFDRMDKLIESLTRKVNTDCVTRD